MTVYLDMAATTPVSSRVADVVLHHMCDEFGNAGSRTHEWGTRAKKTVAAARERVAAAVAAPPESVVFTSGATEADNLALLGLAAHGRRTGRMHILTSATEHKAVLEPLEHLAGEGFEVELLRPGQSGRYPADAFLDRVRDDTLLVSLMHVNNETGVVQPVEELAQRLVETETLLHVDAAQSFGKLPEALLAPIDLLSVSGHKIGAPKGIGALVVRRRGWTKPPLEPLMFGGGQERGLRPGTLPVALVAGFAKALEEFSDNRSIWVHDTLRFRGELIQVVDELGGVVNGDPDHSAPHILNVSFPGVDSEALLVAVGDAAAIATGSACTSASYTPSHVLEAMGLEQARVAGAVRLSWWGYATDDLSPIKLALRSLQGSQ
jgi:cysteine desulfurase